MNQMTIEQRLAEIGVATYPFLARFDPEQMEAKQEDGRYVGRVTAKVGNLEKPDASKRVIHAGAIGSQDVFLSKWMHSAVFGATPVGTGRVWEEGGNVMLEARYDMDRPDGVDAFLMVKSLGQIAQWSLGYRETDLQEDQGFLHFWGVDMIETSPVDRGAADDTKTVYIQREENPATDTIKVANVFEWNKLRLKRLALGV